MTKEQIIKEKWDVSRTFEKKELRSCIVKPSNRVKLKQLFKAFEKLTLIYINEMKHNRLPRKEYLLEKELKGFGITENTLWKQLAYKKAISIIENLMYEYRGSQYNRYKQLYLKCLEKGIHKKFLNTRYKELKLFPKGNIDLFPKGIEYNVTLTIDRSKVFERGKKNKKNFVVFKDFSEKIKTFKIYFKPRDFFNESEFEKTFNEKGNMLVIREFESKEISLYVRYREIVLEKFYPYREEKINPNFLTDEEYDVFYKTEENQNNCVDEFKKLYADDPILLEHILYHLEKD